jgi:hypothetical protein
MPARFDGGEEIPGFKPAAGLEQVRDKYCERMQDRKHRSQQCNDSTYGESGRMRVWEAQHDRDNLSQ